MHLFELISLLIVLAAVFSYLNDRFTRLPTTIGVMLIATASSLTLILLSLFTHWGLRQQAADIVGSIDFNQTLLHGMLAFLLFAGALHLDLSDLAKERGAVLVLALFGTIISTFLVGGAMYLVLKFLSIHVPLIWTLLFGALISPTDPIAVLGIMKKVGAPKSLEIQITGESLFNDGVGVVIFIVLLELLAGDTEISARSIAWVLLREAGGGIGLGMVFGLIVYFMLRRVDNYQVEILLTLALAMGLFALADRVHVSGPIAVVVAGIFIGNQGRTFAMSSKTEEHLDTFWELIDEILNAVLFLLIGMELLVIPFQPRYLIVGAAAILITLGARWLSVAMIVKSMSRFRSFEPGAVRILTWAGLRGGISVAMALSLPSHSEHRGPIVGMTYIVVVFSIFVQGLTIGPFIRRNSPKFTPASQSAAQID